MRRTTRILTVAVAAALLVGFGVARQASAVAIVDILWTGTSGTGTTGGSSIDAVAGDSITGTIRIGLAGEPGGITGYGLSVSWAGSAVELTGSSSTSTPPGGSIPVGAVVIGATSASSWAAVGFAPFGGGATLSIGTITFTVGAGVATDGIDVTPGFFAVGVDGINDAGGFPVSTSFVGASVNAVPEPGTTALLAIGLGSLLVAGRRRS